MDIEEKQRRHIEAVAGWAAKTRAILGPILERHGDRVHFRPGSKGVAMVGLLPDRPQRGKSGIHDLERVAENFEELFAKHCRNVPHGRVTGEKALQSFLISESYQHGRKLASINTASTETADPVDLVFVADEIALPEEGGKVVCDMLALRRDGGRCTPVLIELKDARMLTRLVEQVERYSLLLDEHSQAFEKLFAAILGEPVRFDAFAEKWIVWPHAGSGPEPHEQALAEQGIRVVGYEPFGPSYRFTVGIHRPRCPSCASTSVVVPIFYGEPVELAGALAARGEAVLAGCIVHDDDGTWRCKACKIDFGPHFWPRSNDDESV